MAKESLPALKFAIYNLFIQSPKINHQRNYKLYIEKGKPFFSLSGRRKAKIKNRPSRLTHNERKKGGQYVSSYRKRQAVFLILERLKDKYKERGKKEEIKMKGVKKNL